MREVMGLHDIRVKLDRAKEHLDAFQADIESFVKGDPPPLHVVTYGGSNNIRGMEWTRIPPSRWGALVGDCAHNLRSVLDHIVWDLSGGTGQAPHGCEFPVFIDRTDFFKVDGKGHPARGSGLWKIRGITERNAHIAIRNLQPFLGQDPSRHPLWLIHELDRLDKHRALHIVTGWAHDYTSLLRRKILEVDDLPPGWRQARATQSPLSRAQVGAGVKTKVKMRFDLAIRVTLEPQSVGSHEELDVLLARLIRFVETNVLGLLEPFLSIP